MKVTVTKDFGTAKKPVLPLVPEPTTVSKKEDLAQVDLFSNPADANSTKVKFAFKILEGGTVHFDIKPQIVTLQNNFFTLNLFNHESFCSQRIW